MSPEKLAKGIKELLIDDAIDSYKEMYVQNDLPENPSEYEKDINKVLSALSPRKKCHFID